MSGVVVIPMHAQAAAVTVPADSTCSP